MSLNYIYNFIVCEPSVEFTFVSKIGKKLLSELTNKKPIMETSLVKVYELIHSETNRFLIVHNETDNIITVHLDQEPRYWEEDKTKWFDNVWHVQSLNKSNKIYLYKILEIDYQTDELKHITPSWNDYALFGSAVLNLPENEIKAINQLSTINAYNKQPNVQTEISSLLRKMERTLHPSATNRDSAFVFNDSDNFIWYLHDGSFVFEDQNVWQLIKVSSKKGYSFKVYSQSKYQCFGKFEAFLDKVNSGEIKPQIVMSNRIWKEIDENWMYIFKLNLQFGVEALSEHT